jgi:hypothetical protein
MPNKEIEIDGHVYLLQYGYGTVQKMLSAQTETLPQEKLNLLLKGGSDDITTEDMLDVGLTPQDILKGETHARLQIVSLLLYSVDGNKVDGDYVERKLPYEAGDAIFKAGLEILAETQPSKEEVKN